MSGLFLIRSRGQLQLVGSLEGYPRATVIAENVSPPPSEFHEWRDGKWVENASARETIKRRAALRAMGDADRAEMLLACLAELEERMAKLEARLP